MNHLPSLALLFTLAAGLGCAGSPAPAGPESAPAPQGEAAPAEAAPAAGQRIACHLNCSGIETSYEGATEEEARAAATSQVKDQCRPEDGQYFLVCEPVK